MPEEKKSIKELVLERLAKSGPASLERVVSAMVSETEDKRHELLLKAIKLQEDYENQVKSVSRPDLKSFNAEGVEISSAYSQNALKSFRSAKEKLSKLSACFDKCLEAPTAELFKELGNLVQQGGNAKAPSAEEVRAGN